MSIEAMKLALGALIIWEDSLTDDAALPSLRFAMFGKQALEALRQAIEQAQKDRHALQAKGEHPAPCARFCEANAFQIEIRSLKAKIEQAQEPVAWITQGGKGWLRWHKSYDDNKDSIPLYTSPPQRQWVDLTDDEEMDIALEQNKSRHWVVCEAIRQFKEKNT